MQRLLCTSVPAHPISPAKSFRLRAAHASDRRNEGDVMSITHALTRCSLLIIAMLAPKLDAAVTLSAGCGKTLASGSYQMTDQNAARTYRVFVPSSYKPGIVNPLVMVFHGWGGNENEFLGDSNVTALANQRGYIVVAPRGLGSATPDSNRNSWSFRGSTTGLAGSGDEGAPYTPESTDSAVCDPTLTPNYTYPSCKKVARNTCSWTQCQA